MSRLGVRTVLIGTVESGLIGLCGVLAIALRFGLPWGGDWDAPPGLVISAKFLLLIAVTQLFFYFFDLYDFRRVRQAELLLIRLAQAVGVASIALAGVFFLVPGLSLGRGVFMLAMTLVPAVIFVWRGCLPWLFDRRELLEKVLILGTGPEAVKIARETMECREGGYQVVGFVGDDPAEIGRSLFNPCVVGVVDKLEDIVRHHHPTRIVVALPERRGMLPLDILLRLKLRGKVSIEESTSFYEKLTGKISTDMLRPSWLIFSTSSRRGRWYRYLRRALDVVLAGIGLTLSFPIVLVTAIAIKLDSPGPVFYRQERVGMGGRRFDIIKFRSMTTDAERHGPVWADSGDRRTTRVGRIIRKLRIDEIPQFINILRGDMSFIGPRPERPVFVEQLTREIPFYDQRHLIPCGLTGWAQVRYPYGASVEDAVQKLQYDLYYIKNQSLFLDLIILMETVRIVLFGRGAR